MTDINEIKEKILNTIGNVADATKDMAAKTADKAKGMARIAKLSIDINGDKDVIKKAYHEIGKLYYENHKGDPDGLFVQLCEEITLAMDNIAAREAEIVDLKDQMSSDGDGIDVEFEEVFESDFADVEPAEKADAGTASEDAAAGDADKKDADA